MPAFVFFVHVLLYWILEWSFGLSSHLLVIMLFFEPWGTMSSWFLVSLPCPWKNLSASQVVLLNAYSSMVPDSNLDGLKWFPILHSVFWVEIYRLFLECSRIIWMCKRDHGDYMEHPYRKNCVVYKSAYNVLSAMLQFSKWLWKQYILSYSHNEFLMQFQSYVNSSGSCSSYIFFLLLLFNLLFVVPCCYVFLKSPFRGWNKQLGIRFLSCSWLLPTHLSSSQASKHSFVLLLFCRGYAWQLLHTSAVVSFP